MDQESFSHADISNVIKVSLPAWENTTKVTISWMTGWTLTPHHAKLSTSGGRRMQCYYSVACLPLQQWQTWSVFVLCLRQTVAGCAQWLQQKWEHPLQVSFTFPLTAREEAGLCKMGSMHIDWWRGCHCVCCWPLHIFDDWGRKGAAFLSHIDTGWVMDAHSWSRTETLKCKKALTNVAPQKSQGALEVMHVMFYTCEGLCGIMQFHLKLWSMAHITLQWCVIMCDMPFAENDHSCYNVAITTAMSKLCCRTGNGKCLHILHTHQYSSDFALWNFFLFSCV